MASPLKRNRAEPSWSEGVAEPIDMESGEPLELEGLRYSQEALKEVKERAMAAKSPEEVVGVAEDAAKASYFPIRGISGLTREIIFLNQSCRLCQISYWASCTGPADEVYKCTCPYHFGLCQFWNVPNGYTPKAVLYPTPKKWI